MSSYKVTGCNSSTKLVKLVRTLTIPSLMPAIQLKRTIVLPFASGETTTSTRPLTGQLYPRGS